MMEAQAILIERASAMPAPTWHFLNANDATVQIPAGLLISPDVKVAMPWKAHGAVDEFDNVLADAQEEWEATHPDLSAAEKAALEEVMAAEVDATYGGTARSAYQVSADSIEEARSLIAAFEHGTGKEMAAYLRYAAGERVVVEADCGQAVDTQVVVSAVPDAISAAAIDVVANKGSTVKLSIVVDGPTYEAADAFGFTGTTVRVFADADAQVSIARTQTLANGFVDIDDMGLFASDRARIDVRQAVLGATGSFTGLAGDLRGEASCIDVDTRYLGRGTQTCDFNYSLRHHGAKTKCKLQANGVLAGASSKTLRGTIDFVRGCKGAEGSENETVLLVDEGVHNKTVPVILCNEDDVAGNHGATIGHIREEQLFYLASRGLSQEAAESMFASALVERAAIDAATDIARDAVIRLGESIAPGFAELFTEE